MPLLPIDQQAMFSQLNNVGKDQAVQKQGIVEGQALAADELVKKAAKADSAVTEAKDADDGLEKVKNKKKDLAGQAKEKKKKGKPGEKTEETEEPEVFTDPDLGHHIDITG